ncbi:MAG: S-layer homology domain-containing protein, partial [Bacillota bacterium]|nr:S-layer homology domain-containing protein [Bacillota bacterium]
MGKLRNALIIVVFLACLGGNKALSADISGLSNFKAQNNMEAGTFSDVKSGSWYYSGVKTAYDYSVMGGIGGGKFSPGSNLSKAQALTIAARVHAVYKNKSIKEAPNSAWYIKYYDYAQENLLLPPDIKSPSGLDTENATRAEIAYMFGGILESSDSAAINDAQIPDIGLIGADFTDAAKKMYAAGIIGGKDGGRFDGNGLATRAETAAIVGRIIDPLTRLAFDSKYNPGSSGQESNIQDYQKVTEDKDNVFFAYWDDNKSCYCISRYDKKTKRNTVIYSGEDGAYRSPYAYLGKMTLYNGELYFTEEKYETDTLKSTLRKINPLTKSVTEIYSGDSIQGYAIYG